MNGTIITRYEECILKVTVQVFEPSTLCISAQDTKEVHLVYTNRLKKFTEPCTYDFFIRMPICGYKTIIFVYNIENGNYPDATDKSFKIIDISRKELEKRLDIIDLGNPLIRSFVKFNNRFCYNAGSMRQNTEYISQDGRFRIYYRPIITDYETGAVLTTPARTDMSSGLIEVSAASYVPFTVPMRIILTLHEFAHYNLNNNGGDESEADFNALLIYLSLGWPRVEALEAFRNTFYPVNNPETVELNNERYALIENFINDFENKKFIFSEI